MRMVRAIITLLIAVSIATLPVASAMAFSQKSAAEQTVSMSDAAGAAHDCCPEPGIPCDMDGCKSMSFCASGSVNLSIATWSELTLPLVPVSIPSLPLSEVLHEQTGSPPLHPPQV
jgi:hypothetical protein